MKELEKETRFVQVGVGFSIYSSSAEILGFSLRTRGSASGERKTEWSQFSRSVSGSEEVGDAPPMTRSQTSLTSSTTCKE